MATPQETQELLQKIRDLTRFMLQKHYCENDVEAVVSLFDEDLIWLGAGEDEWGRGGAAVTEIFRSFAGKIPPCNLSEEEYHVQAIAPDAYLCSGRVWITTDASTQISLRVHQRITAVFRRREGEFRCCHVHVSNPYDDMRGDTGFPFQMALQSYRYLQEQVEAQKRQIATQTALLERLSYEDTLTGLFNRNKFNQVMTNLASDREGTLGIACFDLNGLKALNDTEGHHSGDELLCQAASVLRHFFPGTVYRTGGDEFVVIDSVSGEELFRSTVHAARQTLEEEGVSCSAGLSWRSTDRDAEAQYEEADRAMYQDKRRYYSRPASD